MNEITKLAFLATLFELQEENGDVFDLPIDRVQAIAGGAQATAEETSILLVSPMARDELVEQTRRLAQLAAEELFQRVTANDNQLLHLRNKTAFAAVLLPESFAIECPGGRLAVQRLQHPNPARRLFQLTLTLDPTKWFGRHGGLAVAVREPGLDGLIWLSGETDASGLRRVLWSYPAEFGTPAERLDRLIKAGTPWLVIEPA